MSDKPTDRPDIVPVKRNKVIVGFWFRHTEVAQTGELIASALDEAKVPTGWETFISAADYRVVLNDYDDNGGCFVMLASALAPGESPAPPSPALNPSAIFAFLGGVGFILYSLRNYLKDLDKAGFSIIVAAGAIVFGIHTVKILSRAMPSSHVPVPLDKKPTPSFRPPAPGLFGPPHVKGKNYGRIRWFHFVIAPIFPISLILGLIHLGKEKWRSALFLLGVGGVFLTILILLDAKP